MITPRLNRLGRILPVAWQQAIVRWSHGLDLRAIASDLFLEYPPDERGFDPVTTKREFFMIEQLAGRYFRATTMGAENIPAGRALIVTSHSGVVPWDAMLLVSRDLSAHRDGSPGSRSRALGAVCVLEEPPRPDGHGPRRARRVRGAAASGRDCTIFADAGQGNRRAYYLDSERYKVKPQKGFAPGCGGYIKLALRTRSPVVPVAIVGAEEVHYCLGEIPQLAEYLGVPFFPLSLRSPRSRRASTSDSASRSASTPRPRRPTTRRSSTG